MGKGERGLSLPSEKTTPSEERAMSTPIKGAHAHKLPSHQPTQPPPIPPPILVSRFSSECLAYLPCQEHLLQPTPENPLPTAVPPPNPSLAGTLGARHVICFIGLPEVGKAFLAHRTCQYLSFFHGVKAKLFELSEYRARTGAPPGSEENAQLLLSDLSTFMQGNVDGASRNMDSLTPRKQHSSHESSPRTTPSGSRRESFDASDSCGLVTRQHVDAGRVAIVYANDSFDSLKEIWSGTSKEGRRWAADMLKADKSVMAQLMFIEVIVSVPALISANICAKAAARGCPKPSQEHIDEAIGRVADYAGVYVTLQDDGSEDDLSYVKVINYGKKVVANKMNGHLKMRMAQFLSAIHTSRHVIYLSRHGQSEYNVLGKIGGNPPLSAAGDEYAVRLGNWVPANVWRQEGKIVQARLWTSSLQRTILTARHIPHPVLHFPPSSSSLHSLPLQPRPRPDDEEWEQTAPRVYRSLDEIFAGEYEGYRYEDIRAKAAKEASLRSLDKLGYRYPRGESYYDIIQRVAPLIHEIETYHEPLLIVSHQAVLRIMYSYFMGLPRTSAPKIEIPLHTVIKITYDGFSPPKEERFFLGPNLGAKACEDACF
ncbi:hypothetical protein AB1Y20_011715 [Prymnesium parvum]|uniref:6-phosphofructo-2-kinase domain-containing protein n=1 Tax=Prymnesium parvum TaxID=97485 RepID=A0AB34IJT4_PRYPA|mmetsp:Transcript_12029/g.29800  ORF Transcript_12029/g.29800 Transcript_12029/m.29800 type:complete len:598 (+) Transcript_12029:38-1831(+)